MPQTMQVVWQVLLDEIGSSGRYFGGFYLILLHLVADIATPKCPVFKL